MTIISSYGMLRRRKIILIGFASALGVISFCFMVFCAMVHSEASQTSSNQKPLTGSRYLRNIYPILFFVPKVVIEGVIILATLILAICLLTLVGAALHRKRILYFVLFAQFAMFITELVLFISVSLDVFGVVYETSTTESTSITRYFSSTISQTVAETSISDPDGWKKIQDHFKCCGYDFITLYKGSNTANPVENVAVIHTGSSCDPATDETFKVILAAFPEYSVNAYKQYSSLVATPSPNYLCKSKVVGSGYSFYYFGLVAMLLVIGLQIVCVYFTRILVKSKKFKAIRLSSLRSSRGKQNQEERPSRLEQLQKIQRESSLYTFSPSIDPSNQEYSGGSNLSTMVIDGAQDYASMTSDKSIPTIPAPKISALAAPPGSSRSKGLLNTPQTSATNLIPEDGPRVSNLSNTSIGSRSAPSKSFGISEKLDIDDAKILYGGFIHHN